MGFLAYLERLINLSLVNLTFRTTMDTIKEYEKTIQLRIDRKISSLKEFIYQLKDNQTLLTIHADREALINACNSLEKYEEISNQLHNS